MLVQVSSSMNVYEALTYQYTGDETGLQPGQRVVIPLRNQLTTGWITGFHSTYKGRVKNITGIVHDTYRPGQLFLDFACSAADTYFISAGQLLDGSLPPKRKSPGSIYFNVIDSNGKEKAQKLDPHLDTAALEKYAEERPIHFFLKNVPTAAAAAPTSEPVPVSLLQAAPAKDAVPSPTRPGTSQSTAKASMEDVFAGMPLFAGLAKSKSAAEAGAAGKETAHRELAGKKAAGIDGEADWEERAGANGAGETAAGDRLPGEAKIIESGFKRTFLLSYDRLQSYREMTGAYLGKGQSVLIVVPDNLSAKYLAAWLPEADIYNSDVKAKARDELWQAYTSGKVGVVIGGLSAVLLPIANLGAVICERAGTSIYKKTRFSKFDTALLARLRAQIFGLPLLEGYSTYTVEAYHHRHSILVEDKREKPRGDLTGENLLAELESTSREGEPVAEQQPLKGEVNVRMLTAKDKGRGVPERLLDLLKSYYLEKKKILVILNNKESDGFLYCGKCKKLQECPICRARLRIEEQPDRKDTNQQADAASRANIYCPRCKTGQAFSGICPVCGEELITTDDMSIRSTAKAIKREISETGIAQLSAAGLNDEKDVLEEVDNAHIVISTPVILNPFFKEIFDAVVYVRPESLFIMDEYHAAEMIFSLLSELREVVKRNGSIDVFSTFHFHYALQLVNREEDFFERELQYREWFRLPPFANVYRIRVRDKNVRRLGQEMRRIYSRFKTALGITRQYLVSRQKSAGYYHGILEAHSQPDAVRASGLVQARHIDIDPLML